MGGKNKNKKKKQKYPKAAKRQIGDDWGIFSLLDPEDVLDLHGYTKMEAEIEAEEFIRQARRLRYRKVRIITGCGNHSPGGAGILGPAIAGFIKNLGLPYRYADAWQGGSGAIDIKLA